MNAETPTRNGLFKWLLSSAGLTGLLLLIGFIIDLADQEFLGFRLREAAPPDFYIARAGEFLLSSVLLVLEVALDRWWFTLALFGTILWWSMRGSTVPLPQSIRLGMLGFGIVMIAAQLLYFVVPALSVRDLLVQDVGTIAPAAELPLFSGRTHRLYTAHVCPRLTKVQHQEAKNRSIECSEKYDYRDFRRDYFVSSLFLLIGALVILVYAPATRESRLPATWVDRGDADVAVQRSLVIATATLLCIGLVGLLTLYPRTIGDSNLNRVVVYPKAGEPMRGPGEGRVQPENESFRPDSISEGFLLSRTKDEVVVYFKADRTIWIVDASHVQYLQFLEMGDVLEDYFQASLADTLAEY